VIHKENINYEKLLIKNVNKLDVQRL